MKTPLIDGQKIFLETIDKKLKHQDYDRVTAIAEDFQIYATGIGVSKKLMQFNPRETEDQSQFGKAFWCRAAAQALRNGWHS